MRMSDQPAYEVLALRYATTDLHRPRRENFFPGMDLHDGEMPLDYYVWAVRGEGRCLLVDTGFGEEAAQTRNRILLHHPADLLRQAGIDPETITDVILTHLHYDHAGNLDRFPKARFHLQESEMRFATGRHMCHSCLRAPFECRDVTEAVKIVFDGRMVFHDGDAEIFPGIEVFRMGGHSDGLQVVRVATARGKVLLASDAFHFNENRTRRAPFPIVYHVGEMLEGFIRCEELVGGDADLLIPGHDPDVRLRWPILSADLPDVVRLDLHPLKRTLKK